MLDTILICVHSVGASTFTNVRSDGQVLSSMSTVLGKYIYLCPQCWASTVVLIGQVLGPSTPINVHSVGHGQVPLPMSTALAFINLHSVGQVYLSMPPVLGKYM